MSLSGVLKSTPLPDSLRLKQTDSSNVESSAISVGSIRDDSTPKEPKRLRLDHSCEAIIEQLMTPIMEHSTKRDSHLESDKSIISPVGLPSQSQDTKVCKSLSNTVDPVYSERVGAAKSVHLRRVFTINVFNLTIN